MTKLFIATPAFDGKVHIQYALALSETKELLARNGIDCVINIHASGSLLVAERNRLNKAFLKSDCTHMICIDSDLGWPAQAVLAMLQHDLDFVVGCYPARGEKTFCFRPVVDDTKAIIKNEKNLLKMNYVPAGFMMIKRHVIERMNSFFPELYFEPKADSLKQENGICLFNTEVHEGEFWGEDYVFCRRARQAGFEIWCDPLIEFDHAGLRGCLMQVLTDKSPEEQNNEVTNAAI